MIKVYYLYEDDDLECKGDCREVVAFDGDWRIDLPQAVEEEDYPLRAMQVWLHGVRYANPLVDIKICEYHLTHRDHERQLQALT